MHGWNCRLPFAARVGVASQFSNEAVQSIDDQAVTAGMAQGNYLQQLSARLANGLAQIPGAFRERHAAYLLNSQNLDGGFPGREGGSDLYYTGFALRSLSVLDALSPEVAVRAADYLRTCLTHHTSVVDFFCLLYASLLIQLHGGPDVLATGPLDWPERVAGMLETFRTADGGYAKAA